MEFPTKATLTALVLSRDRPCPNHQVVTNNTKTIIRIEKVVRRRRDARAGPVDSFQRPSPGLSKRGDPSLAGSSSLRGKGPMVGDVGGEASSMVMKVAAVAWEG